jgi:hypothetical protein
LETKGGKGNFRGCNASSHTKFVQSGIQMYYQIMFGMYDMDWQVLFPPLFRLGLSFLIINDEIMAIFNERIG